MLTWTWLFVINLFATITVCVLYWAVAREKEAKLGWGDMTERANELVKAILAR